jgi:alkylation response protein AidB-like acyl-CoA dehydrogenase
VDLRHREADERFRAEFRAWLAANLPDRLREDGLWSRSADSNEAFDARRQWEANKARAGWAGIDWPVEYGGRGGTPAQKAIYDEEMARGQAPRTVNPLGLTFLAPTVMRYGTEQQKKDIIGPLLHNDVIWCQGFSEPGAGSDLAALSTRAVRDGDEFVVTGQKVWITNAMRGDWIFSLVRTSSEGPKHAGITMLLIDMHSPGVEARPLQQMSGSAEFGEVFFTDVRVPVTNVLGEIDRGWEVAMTLLSFERGASAIGQYTEFRHELDEVIGIAHLIERDGRPAAADPVLRQRIANSVVELELLRLHSLHVLTQTEAGRDLGAGASITKLQWSEAYQQVGEVFAAVTGLLHQMPDAAPELDLSVLLEQYLWSRSVTIWGGSSEVQRNIVAERLLGLPR